MTKFSCVACAAVLFVSTSRANELPPSNDARSAAQAPATQPTTQPSGATTQPIDPKLKPLIDQLGDDNPNTRQQAFAALRKLGNDAVPALRAAANDDDPQIRTSAQALIAQITQKKEVATADADLPSELFNRRGGLFLHNVHIQAGGMAQLQVRMSVTNGKSTRDVTANENGRKIKIHEDNDGVSLQITDNGETKEYKAKTPDELKEKEPEAYKTYEKFSQKAGGQMRGIVLPPKVAPQ